MRRALARGTGPVVGLALATASLAACTPSDPEPASDVGVQMFQWTWDAIATECTDVLGPAGYGWVLTSPPQEHVLGEAWWTAYQPVSHRVESRLGTREEFAAMVDTCGQAGVAVIADAVVNHMTGDSDGGVGWAGTDYEHYEYPGLYSDADGDFHHCGLASDDDIADYQDADEVQTCELVNLADLDTGSEHVRATIVAYLEDLLSLGVAGFRIDAAKHMAADDVAAVVAELPEGTRILQEVIGGAGEPIQPADYVAAGQVFDFLYGRELESIGRTGSVDRAEGLGSSPGSLPSEAAVVFVENHDTERNGSTLRWDDGWSSVLADVLMLAGSYGTPVLYSGYAFTDRDAGPEQDADGAVLDAVCAEGSGPDAELADGAWVCQHRWPALTGMIGWRIAAADGAVVDGWTDTKAIAFGRGETAFVVVNGSPDERTDTLSTSLPDGTYCDVVAGAPVDGACAGGEVTVVGGSVEVTVPGRTAVALHVGAQPEG